MATKTTITVKTMLLMTLLLIGSLLFAQAKKDMMTELQNDIKDYKGKNILPEMLKWKSTLDKAMSAEDLKTLNDLRAKASEFKAKRLEEQKKIREAKKSSADFDKEDVKEMREENRKEMKELAVAVAPLAKKYKDVLEKIGTEAKSKNETWRIDIKGIIDKWRDEHKSDFESMKGPKAKDRQEKMGKRLKAMQEMKGDKKQMVVKFMLWDGKEIDDAPGMMPLGMSDGNKPDMKAKPGKKAFMTKNDVKNYPNPFSDKTTISFNLSTTERCVLTVSDNSGNQIATLFDGELNEGMHSFVFNASDSKYISGTYIYQLKTDSFTKSGKMVLKK